MMRALLPLILLGCPGPVDPPDTGTLPGRNGLRVVLEARLDPAITSLQATIGEVVLGGEGPDGPLNLGTASPLSGDLTQSPLSAILDLETGTYRNVEVLLALDGDPSLRLEAVWEGRSVVVVIDERIAISDRVADLIIAQGPDQEVEFTLDPSGWLDRLDEGELEPSEGSILISASENSEAYAELIDEILDTESDFEDDEPDTGL